MASNNALKLLVRLKALDELSKPLTQAGGAAEKTAKRLKALEAQQRQVNGYRKLQQELADTGSQMEKARQRVRELHQGLERVAQPTQKMRDEYSAAARAVRGLERRQATLTGRLDTQRNKLEQAGINTRNLATTQRRLNRNSERYNNLLKAQQRQLEQVAAKEAKLQNLKERHGKSMDHLAKVGVAGYAGMAVGQRVGSGLGGFLAPGMDFDAAMSEVQALSRLDKSDPALAAMREQAQQLGATTKFTGADAARGQAFLAMAGFTPESIQAAMPGLLDMAAAGGTDLGVTSDIASNIMGGFGIEASEMGRVADVLTQTFTTSNTTLEMLGDTMKYVGPVARTAGMGLEQAAATAGLLGNVGIQASQAGTTLRSMLSRLAAPTSKASGALKALGVDALDMNGNVRDIPTLLSEVAKATENMGSGKRLQHLKDIFGEEPAAGMAELIDKAGSGGIADYLKVIENSAGAAKAVAEVRQDNLRGDLVGLSSAWGNIGTVVSGIVDPALRSATQAITGWLRGAAEWIKEHPQFTKGLTLAVGGFAALAAVGGSLLVAFASLAGPLKILIFTMQLGAGNAATLVNGLRLVGGALKALVVGGGPVMWLIAAIATAAYLIYQNWEPIKQFFVDLWNDPIATITGFGNFLLSFFPESMQTVLGTIVKYSPVGLIIGHWEQITGFFQNLPERFKALGGMIIGGLVEGIKSHFAFLSEIISKAAELLPDVVREKLGIHSPSRVFAEIGQHTMDGLDQGIEKHQRGPLARAGDVATQMIGTGRGNGRGHLMAAGGAGGGTLIVEQINVYAAPGQDATSIAREVRAELARHNQQRARAGRGALHDKE